MPKYNFPRSYREAASALAGQSTVSICESITLRKIGHSLCLHHENIPFTLFQPDGRIKVLTFGTNSNHATLNRINACLPWPYCVRNRGLHAALIDRRRPEFPLALFLSSTTFEPQSPSTPPAQVEEESCAEQSA